MTDDPLRAAMVEYIHDNTEASGFICRHANQHKWDCRTRADEMLADDRIRAALVADTARPFDPKATHDDPLDETWVDTARPGLDVEALGAAIEGHVADAYRSIPKSAEHQDHSCHGGCASDLAARLTEDRP